MSVIVFCRRLAAFESLFFEIKKVAVAASILLLFIIAGTVTARATTVVDRNDGMIFGTRFSPQSEQAYQPRKIHRSQRHQAHRAARRLLPETQEAPQIESSHSSSVLAEAKHWIGHGNVTGTHRAWCADFANFVLKRSGHRTSGSGMVNSLLHVGPHVSSPSPGDIVVMRSHVTIFAGFGGRGFYGLGGNQHNRVAMSNYPLRSVVAYVRPN